MTRYDLVRTPFGNLLDTFFSDSLNGAAHHYAPNPAHSDWAGFRVKAKENGYSLEADLAGVKKEDLKIEVLGDTLKVSGFRGSKEEKDGFCEYSEFTKTFSVGSDVDTDNIEARFENGYLNLFIPKAANKKAKLIDLK
ncbi:MAG: Hsp20/alpha crystallin family protein [Bdellovibrionota bacterium]